MRVGIVITALVLALAVFAPRADAQPVCAGFTDVGPCNQPLGANVNWLKNRAITLGCTPTLYCPNDGVGRLQMAAFMNRMGNTLTPKVFSIEQSGGTLDFSAQHDLCQTPDVPASMRTYPVTVDANGSLSYTINGGQIVNIVVTRSANGGQFTSAGPGNTAVVETGVRQQTSALANGELLPFSPGSASAAYKFALSIFGTGGGPMITSWTCHLQVIVRNGTDLGGN